MSTISVIIPAYNAERTILATIASVQKQTFSDFEIVVIDDGSTDRTSELVKSIGDERIQVFSYPNGGVCAARNRGISHATGEFIAPLDSDDLWTSDKLELQLAALQKHPKAGVAYSWTSDFLDGQEEIFCHYDPVLFEGNVLSELLIRNFLNSGSNPLIRRKAIESVGEFDPACTLFEDWDFYLRLALHWPFVVVPKYQIRYRLSPYSGSAQVKAIEKNGLFTIEKVYSMVPAELQSLKSQTLGDFYQYCAQQYLRYGKNVSEINQAAPRIWKAIHLHPQNLFSKHTQGLIRWFIKRWVLLQLGRNS